MTDDTPEPDLQDIVEAMAPEDGTLAIDDPAPVVRELMVIAMHLSVAELDTLLAKARFLLDHGR